METRRGVRDRSRLRDCDERHWRRDEAHRRFGYRALSAAWTQRDIDAAQCALLRDEAAWGADGVRRLIERQNFGDQREHRRGAIALLGVVLADSLWGFVGA